MIGWISEEKQIRLCSLALCAYKISRRTRIFSTNLHSTIKSEFDPCLISNLDLDTTDLCTTFSSNSAIILVNCNIFSICIDYYLYIVSCYFILYWSCFQYCSSVIAAYITTCQSLFYVLYLYTATTVCL